MQGISNTELQFEIAMRDQVIHNQREAQRNLWDLLLGVGLDQKQSFELAAKQGITIEDWSISPSLGLFHRMQSHNLGCGISSPSIYGHSIGEPYLRSDFGSSSFLSARLNLAHSLCRKEHSSYYLVTHNHSPMTYHRHSGQHFCNSNPSTCFFTRNEHAEMRIHPSPCSEGYISTSCFRQDTGQQQRVCL